MSRRTPGCRSPRPGRETTIRVTTSAARRFPPAPRQLNALHWSSGASTCLSGRSAAPCTPTATQESPGGRRRCPLPAARCPLPAPSPTRWRRRPGSRRPQPRALPCGVTDAGAAAGSRRSLRRQNVQKADVVLVSPRPAPSLPHTEVPAVPWVPPVTGNHRVPHPKLSAQQLPSHSARENEHN